jgi:GNAT superfamily N-acetyltransferase
LLRIGLFVHEESDPMRIRNYRQIDLPRLIEIQQRAAEVDGIDLKDVPDLTALLLDPETQAEHNVFVITDDDDELNTWGQGETLEGIEGEIVGYTRLELRQDAQAYHFLCQGAVHPNFRHMNAGRALLISALNWVRIWGAEIEFEAEQEGRPIYFEALLPLHDPASPHLAAKCEMQDAGQPPNNGLRLYRREL